MADHRIDNPGSNPPAPRQIPIDQRRLAGMLAMLDPHAARRAVAAFFDELAPIPLPLRRPPEAPIAHEAQIVSLPGRPREARAEPPHAIVPLPMPRAAAAFVPIRGQSPNGAVAWEVRPAPTRTTSASATDAASPETPPADAPRIAVTLWVRVPGMRGGRLRLRVDGQDVTGSPAEPDLCFENHHPGNVETRCECELTLPSAVGAAFSEGSTLSFRLTGIRSLGSGPSVSESTGSGVVRTCCFCHDGTTLLTSSDRVLRAWDLASGNVDVELAGHAGEVLTCAVSPATTLVATGAGDGTVRLWDPVSGEQTHVLQGHGDAVTTVALSADGELVLSGSSDGTLRLWHIDSSDCLRELTGSGEPVRAATLAEDGRVAISAAASTLWRWDLLTSTRAARHGHQADITAVTLTRDGRRALSGDDTGRLLLWNLEDDRPATELPAHPAAVVGLALGPDATEVVSADANGTVRVTRLDTKAVRCEHTTGGPAACMALDPNGEQVAVVGKDGAVWLWDLPPEPVEA